MNECSSFLRRILYMPILSEKKRWLDAFSNAWKDSGIVLSRLFTRISRFLDSHFLHDYTGRLL